MKTILSKTIVFLCLFCSFNTLLAEIKLPAIVSSHMVLQRDTEVNLWGWAEPKEKIVLSASWLTDEINLVTDKEGNWSTTVLTTTTTDAQTITLKSKQSEIVLEDILFGEVWLCSGQSNMYQPLRGYNGQPTYGCQQAMVKANNAQLRLFMVETQASLEPQKDVAKYRSWQSATSQNVSNFSAIAYFFGSQLQETLDVPVGMIHTSWGGSRVEAWMSETSLENLVSFDKEDLDSKKKPHHQPTLLYNAMINPLTPYNIKGALWYQGESNRLEPEKYKQLLPAMVNDWRANWDEDFAFYYVQIAPYGYKGDEYSTPINSSYIREALMECKGIIPNSGMAVAMDAGEQWCIHPAKKKEVADRLLYNALNQTYGLTTFDGQSPEYVKLEKNNKGLKLHFKHAESGLYTYNGLQDFEIAGEDKVFYPAQAKIVGRKYVYVESEMVENPIAVRYAWSNFVVGSLFDANLLPASSFRTDDWDDATQWKGQENNK